MVSLEKKITELENKLKTIEGILRGFRGRVNVIGYPDNTLTLNENFDVAQHLKDNEQGFADVLTQVDETITPIISEVETDLATHIAETTTAHGLGESAFHPDSYFDLAGSAATVQGNLDTHAGLTTSAHGGIVSSTDPRLTDARTPLPHTQGWDTITGKPYDRFSCQLTAIKDKAHTICSFPISTIGASNKIVTLNCNDTDYKSIIKFDVLNYANDTAGQWKLCFPVMIKDSFSEQTFALEVFCNTTVVKFRLRLLVSP